MSSYLRRRNRPLSENRAMGSDNEWGLHILADRTDVDPSDGVDIVALHGFPGHWERTWRHQSGIMWLRDLLPTEIPNARIMSFGWPAKLFPKRSLQVTSNDISMMLLTRLSDLRRGDKSQRPIIFLSFSSGGVLLKKAYIMALMRFDAIFHCTVCLAFFGTPHRGVIDAYTNLIRVYKSALFLAMRPWSPLTEHDPVNITSKSSKSALEVLNDDFLAALKLSDKISILSFYEMKITPTLNYKLVDKHSAMLGLHDLETTVGLNSDHLGLVKYASADDPQYQLVLGHIRSVVDSVSNYSTIETRVGSHFAFDANRLKEPGELEEKKGIRADKRFDDLRVEVQSVVAERIPSPRPARIAILDTGLDLHHPDIVSQRDRIAEQKCFLPNETDIADLHGHGTHLTDILMKTAPMAQIYIAKVFREGKEFELEENAVIIAEAIRHAAKKWDVDIISMSWGGPSDIPEIKSAIREAFYLGVSLFAAASNDGPISAVAFPARMPQVISVNSYDGYGRPSNFSPPPRPGTNLAVLGEYIKAPWPRPTQGPDGQTARMAGTSMAAAVAAGIAAMVLEYARQDGPRGSKVDRPNDLKHCDEIRKVLLSMTRENSGFQCLVPGELFYKKYQGRTIHTLICSRINGILGGISA